MRCFFIASLPGHWFSLNVKLLWINFSYLVGDKLLLNFVAGMLLGLTQDFVKYRISHVLAGVAIALLLIVAMTLQQWGYERFICFGIPSVFMVAIAVFTESKGWARSKLLVFLGAASYSTYLSHFYIMHWGHGWLKSWGLSGDISGFLLMVIAQLLGCLLYQFLERPVSNLIRGMMFGRTAEASVVNVNKEPA